MVKKALLIGINYKNTPVPLNGCINDVLRVKDVLQSKYGYKNENIMLLKDDMANPARMPTKSNILQQLRSIIYDRGQAVPTEIWIHYSGHGSQVKDTSGDELDGLDEVLVPCDYQTKGMITDDEINQMVKDAPCKTMVIVDACHSASMCDLEYGLCIDIPKRQFCRIRNNTKHLENPNVYSISGCGDTQTSADAYNPDLKLGVGAFTDAFLFILGANKYAGSLLFLFQETCRLLHQRRFEQMPTLSSSGTAFQYTFAPAQMQFI